MVVRDLLKSVKFSSKRWAAVGHLIYVYISYVFRNLVVTYQYAWTTSYIIWQIGVEKEDVQFRSIFHIIKDSLEDRSSSDVNEVHASIQTEVRYKLIIDPSDDDSLVRLLFKYGVLRRDQTRLYICSDFPGDSHIMQVDNEYSHTLMWN